MAKKREDKKNWKTAIYNPTGIEIEWDPEEFFEWLDEYEKQTKV